MRRTTEATSIKTFYWLDRVPPPQRIYIYAMFGEGKAIRSDEFANDNRKVAAK